MIIITTSTIVNSYYNFVINLGIVLFSAPVADFVSLAFSSFLFFFFILINVYATNRVTGVILKLTKDCNLKKTGKCHKPKKFHRSRQTDCNRA